MGADFVTRVKAFQVPTEEEADIEELISFLEQHDIEYEGEGNTLTFYEKRGGGYLDTANLGDWVIITAEGELFTEADENFRKWYAPVIAIDAKIAALAERVKAKRDEFYPGTEYWLDYEDIRKELEKLNVGENQATGSEDGRTPAGVRA
jgi:hypothetical protein